MNTLFASCQRNGPKALLWFSIFWLALLALSCRSTPAPKTSDMPKRIALVSDTHTNPGTNVDRARYQGYLEQVIAEVNDAKVDVVLMAGDLTEDGSPEELASFREQIKRFRAPVLFVPGNHDVGNKLIPGKGGTVTAKRVANYEMKMGPSFFVRQLAGVRVIGINSPIFGSGFPQEQAMWKLLEKELAKPSPQPTVVFSHYPAFVKTPGEGGGDYWNIEPEPRRRLLALLQQGGVRAMLTGHLHRELINRHEGILYATTPPVSFGLPAGKQAEGWTLVTLPAQGEAQAEFRHIRH